MDLLNITSFEDFSIDQNLNFDTLSRDSSMAPRSKPPAKASLPRRLASTRISRTRRWPARSDEPHVYESLTQHCEQLSQTPVEIGLGFDSGRNMLAIFQDQKDRVPRLAFNIRVKRRRPNKDFPEFKGIEAADLPCGITLKEVCQFYPLQVWGDGLRIFIAEGWSAKEIWSHLPKDARRNGAAKRPWNNLQQAMGREVETMGEEETGTSRRNRPKRNPLKRKRDDSDASEVVPIFLNEGALPNSDIEGFGGHDLPVYGTPCSLMTSSSPAGTQYTGHLPGSTFRPNLHAEYQYLSPPDQLIDISYPKRRRMGQMPSGQHMAQPPVLPANFRWHRSPDTPQQVPTPSSTSKPLLANCAWEQCTRPPNRYSNPQWLIPDTNQQPFGSWQDMASTTGYPPRSDAGFQSNGIPPASPHQAGLSEGMNLAASERPDMFSFPELEHPGNTEPGALGYVSDHQTALFNVGSHPHGLGYVNNSLLNQYSTSHITNEFDEVFHREGLY